MTEKPIRVLLVEDDNEDFLIIQKMLTVVKKKCFELDRVSTYKAAIQKLEQRDHDVCLLDYRLEGRNGLDLLKEAALKGHTIPIIFLTGQGEHEVDVEAIQLGAADFLYKNKIDGDMLERSVRYALERHKAEENRIRLAAIVESSEDAIYSVTLEGVILSWNAGAQRVYGFAAEEAGGRHISLVLSPAQEKEFTAFLSMVREGKAVINAMAAHRTKQGKDVLLSLTLSPIRNPLGQVVRASVVARDITESEKSKALQEMLRGERDQLLERLQLQMQIMPIAFLVLDHDFNITYWNPAAGRIFGYNFPEVEGKSVTLLLADSEKAEVEQTIQKVKAGYTPPHGSIRKIRQKKGTFITCEFYNGTLKDSEGYLTGTMVMAIDITERRKAEEVQSQLAAILQQTPDAVIGVDLEGRIFNWNRGAEMLYGYSFDEIVGQQVSLLVPPDRQEESQKITQAASQGEVVQGFETVQIKKNGDLVDVSLTLSPIKESRGKSIGISAVIRDITERKKAEDSLRKHEEQLRLVEKMNAIGRLAGGVAHDFNNLLSVIGGNAEFLIGNLEKDSPQLEELGEIQKAVRRGADLTKQLLVFGQKQVVQPQPVNLNDLGAEMNKMLKRLIDANIDLAIIQDKDLKPILADPGQIQQVILNLVLNSRDAMPEGGHLIIETKNLESAQMEREKRPTLPIGDYVRLSVTDTGTGMSQEIQKHVFEPFFTTKAGKGTGLGLASVYGIVRKWSGHIFLYSAPGMGSTFTLYFPALQEAETTPAKAQPTASISQGTETILLAEDEEPVRKIIVRTLKKYGYEVIEAKNGIDAVQKAWEYKKAIHLLLTDTVMPKMNGKELADEIQKGRPETKVLFISGYPREILSQQGILDSEIRLVQKPFEQDDLVMKIREVLDER